MKQIVSVSIGFGTEDAVRLVDLFHVDLRKGGTVPVFSPCSPFTFLDSAPSVVLREFPRPLSFPLPVSFHFPRSIFFFF